MSLNPHYTRKTLSKALNISISTIKRHEKQGVIEGIRIGRLIRFAPDTITRLSSLKSDKDCDDDQIDDGTATEAINHETIEQPPHLPENIEPAKLPASPTPSISKRFHFDGTYLIATIFSMISRVLKLTTNK